MSATRRTTSAPLEVSGPRAGLGASEWVVTAAHARPRSSAPSRPWGTHHVKRIGQPGTACGLVTSGWHVFWDMSLSSRSGSLCSGCAHALHDGGVTIRAVIPRPDGSGT